MSKRPEGAAEIVFHCCQGALGCPVITRRFLEICLAADTAALRESVSHIARVLRAH